MKMYAIAVVVFLAVFHQGSSLKCYVCDTTISVNETAGCTPGKPFDAKFLTECDSNQTYCVTTNVTVVIQVSETEERTVTNIGFTCETEELSGCKTKPGDDKPVKTTTTCYSSSQKALVTTTEEKAATKTTTTSKPTDKPISTTSDAQAIGIRMHTLFNMAIAVLFALLLV